MDDIIWLDRIIEKIAWKHNVLPSEVEQVLCGQCRMFRKEKGRVEGEHLYNALGRTESGRFLSVFFISKDWEQGAYRYGEGHEQSGKESVCEKIREQRTCLLPPVKKYSEMAGQEIPSKPICKHCSRCSLRNLVDRLKKDLNA